MIVLHIGPFKTATSYIQQNLFAARDYLSDYGWEYPFNGLRGYAQHLLGFRPDDFLKPDGTGYPAFQDLIARARSGRNVIISAEAMCRWSPATFKQFAKLADGIPIRVVYTVRDPLDLLYSYWQEEVKQGYVNSFPEMFAVHFSDPMASRVLNPLRELNHLLRSKLFEVKILFFDDISARGLDICEVLVRNVLGLKDFVSKSKAKANESYDPEFIEFLRILTIRFSAGRMLAGSEFRKKIISSTTHEERSEISQVIAESCSEARRTLNFSRKSQFYNTLPSRMRVLSKHNVGGRAISAKSFPQTPSTILYYSEAALLQNDVFLGLVQRYSPLATGVDFSGDQKWKS